MPEISRHQKQYLLQYKKEKRLIFTARILLFVLFMGLWEMSARCRWIDSFIFSSPSLIGKILSFHVQGSVSVFPILELL